MRTSKMQKFRIVLRVSVAALFFVHANVAAAAVLRWGNHGSEVVQLQERLQYLNYDIGSIDGSFGPWTAQAVEEFQTDNGLTADGIVGDQTWEALRKAVPRVSRSGHLRMVQQITAISQRYIGIPYVWGGNGPQGFDCSGFVQYVFRLNGIDLPRTADVQFAVGLPVNYEQLRSGDLVFFSTYAPGPSHVGIYLGDSQFINATSSRGVVIDSLDSAYWAGRYIGARRVIR